MRRSRGKPDRPAVSVVVPFGGDEKEARALAGSLVALELREGDELIVADNTASGATRDRLVTLSATVCTTDEEFAAGRDPAPDGRRSRVTFGPRIVSAVGERSSYHARNAGARAASGEWLLFMDADCVPAAGLLDRYFADPVPEDCALLAGSIAGVTGQDSLLARYTRSRRFYDGRRGLGATGELEGGAAPAGNLMVRRSAFEAAGGFVEGIRSAGDYDLCWRMQVGGWRLLRRPDATVFHRHRDEWRSFLSMIARYGAGASWINRRYPGASPRWPLLAGVLGSGRDIAANVLRGRSEEALFRALDAVGLFAHNVGYAGSNELRA